MVDQAIRQTVLVPTDLFRGQYTQGSRSYYLLLSLSELEEIQQRVNAFYDGSKPRGGGSSLLKELQAIDTIKQSLEVHLENIRRLLRPRRRQRTQISTALAKQQDRIIASVTSQLRQLTPRGLRQLAQTQLGEKHLAYTTEELPLVLSTYQVTGSLIDPSIKDTG